MAKVQELTISSFREFVQIIKECGVLKSLEEFDLEESTEKVIIMVS